MEPLNVAVMHFRPFCNQDPPALARLWSEAADPGMLPSGMTVRMLEDLVLGKPYFDRKGLILALEDKTLAGFAHAGFGPNADRGGLAHEVGVICMVVVHPRFRRRGVARELSRRVEGYLQERGAREIYAGGVRPFDPFYGGFYGGSQLPGVLESDVGPRRLFETLGYRVVDSLRRMRCDLEAFQPVVSREQLLIRRRARVTVQIDPPPANWWEACTYGEYHRARFELIPTAGGLTQAAATLWSADPIAWRPGVRAIGLIDIQVSPDRRRGGLATFLLGEAFRELRVEGYSLCDTQVLEKDAVMSGLLKKLQFKEIDCGNVYRKSAEGAA